MHANYFDCNVIEQDNTIIQKKKRILNENKYITYLSILTSIPLFSFIYQSISECIYNNRHQILFLVQTISRQLQVNATVLVHVTVLHVRIIQV